MESSDQIQIILATRNPLSSIPSPGMILAMEVLMLGSMHPPIWSGLFYRSLRDSSKAA